MSTEENKALVRRFLEAQNKGDLAALEEIIAPDFIDHSVLPGQGPTREDYIQGVAEDQAAFSGAQLRIRGPISRRGYGYDAPHRTWCPRQGDVHGYGTNRGAIGDHGYHRQPGSRRQDHRRVERGRGYVRANAAPPRPGVTRARAVRAGAERSAAHPASLVAKGAASSRQLEYRSVLQTRSGGRGRLLRLPPPGKRTRGCRHW
jgi:hypothetical protein